MFFPPGLCRAVFLDYPCRYHLCLLTLSKKEGMWQTLDFNCKILHQWVGKFHFHKTTLNINAYWQLGTARELSKWNMKKNFFPLKRNTLILFVEENAVDCQKLQKLRTCCNYDGGSNKNACACRMYNSRRSHAFSHPRVWPSVVVYWPLE